MTIGTVVDIGENAARTMDFDRQPLKPGDRVACPFTTSCGRCFYCERGLTCRCVEGQLFGWVEGGTGLQGTQAELDPGDGRPQFMGHITEKALLTFHKSRQP